MVNHSSLTLEQKIGQIMMFGYLTPELPEHLEKWIKDYHIGNVILFGRNVTTLPETHERMQTLQQWALEGGQPAPLLISTDQENGVVTRLKEGSTAFPGAMTLGATWNPEYAEQIFAATGAELLSAGINMNLAPIIDVNNNPQNPVIGVRSFGEDVNLVTEMGRKSVRGLEQSGVVAVVKHFPGHGDTHADSHLTLPTIPHDIERLKEVELAPFRACITDGVPVVMIAHIHFPAFDNSGQPATVSRPIVTGLLKEELGFDGLVMTDCMEMNAVSQTLGSGEAAVQAINAGVDLILVSHELHYQEEVYQRVLQACQTGEISSERLNEAVSKVLELKEKYLDWQSSAKEKPVAFDAVQHEELSTKVLSQAITLVRNEEQLIPLVPERHSEVAVIMPAIVGLTLAEDEHEPQQGLAPALRNHLAQVKSLVVQVEMSEEEQQRVLRVVEDIETVIMCTYNAQLYSSQVHLIKLLEDSGKKLIVISLRNPYDLTLFPDVKTYIAAYEFKDLAMSVLAEILVGVKKPVGRLPVTLPDLYKAKHRVEE